MIDGICQRNVRSAGTFMFPTFCCFSKYYKVLYCSDR